MGWNYLNSLSPFADLSIRSDCFLSIPLFLTRALKCGGFVLQLPSPPTDEEGGFIFIHHEDVRLSQKADEVYTQLIKLLKDQHEVTVLSLQKMCSFYLSYNVPRILLILL